MNQNKISAFCRKKVIQSEETDNKFSILFFWGIPAPRGLGGPYLATDENW